MKDCTFLIGQLCFLWFWSVINIKRQVNWINMENIICVEKSAMLNHRKNVNKQRLSSCYDFWTIMMTNHSTDFSCNLSKNEIRIDDLAAAAWLFENNVFYTKDTTHWVGLHLKNNEDRNRPFSCGYRICCGYHWHGHIWPPFLSLIPIMI